MAISSQETHYNGAKFSLVVCPLHIIESSHRLAKPLQETVQDHACRQATLPLETNSSGNKFCVMVCPLCSNEPAPRRLSKPVQETSPCQHNSVVLMPASATGSYLAVAKTKVHSYDTNGRTQIMNFRSFHEFSRS